MEPNANRNSESSSEPPDDLENLEAQIAALKREVSQLEQKRRELQRSQPPPTPHPAPVHRPETAQNSAMPVRLWLLLVGIAFAVAGVAQYALQVPVQVGGWALNGWMLYAVAVILFIIALGRSRPAQFAEGRLENPPDRVSPSRFVWIFLILAVLTTTASVILFKDPTRGQSAWSLHVISVLLFIAAFIPFEALDRISFPSAGEIRTKLIHLIPVLMVFALAIFARFWQLRDFPFGEWTDEAQNGLTAAQILQDPNFRPVFIPETQIPSHFNYLIALSFSFFGINSLAIRFVVTMFGVLSVFFAYLLFRRWFGEWMGLFAACVLAVMRYHLTFSRFGLHGIATPAFEFAALYVLDRALAKKKLSDFAWLGLIIGYGLAFYFAFRLFPVALAIFVVGLLIGSAFMKRERRENFLYSVRQMGPHILVTALGLLIALAPIIQFAWKNPDLFFSRTTSVSIFGNRENPNLKAALIGNSIKHLEMFNLRGDNNGRHNLPGAPMLDPVTGVLFILGVAYSLWCWRDPTNALMVLVFLLALQGGILSLDFEAPQAYRSIGVIPALVYFITVPVAVVYQAVIRIPKRDDTTRAWVYPRIVLSLALIVLLAVVTYSNFDTFFNKQKNDPAVWAAYSTAETLVSNELNRLSATHDFIVSALYYDPPTVRFLAGHVTNSHRWTVSDRLPMPHEDNGHGIVMLFDEKLMSAYREAQWFYPRATFIEHRAPSGGGTLLWEVILTPEDLRSVEGVTARYFTGDAAEGQPAKEETLSQLTTDWTKTSPLAKPFVAELRSTLHITEYGNYRFSLRGDQAGASLWIDEYPVTDAPLTLARGNHSLRLQASSRVNRLELLWQPPTASDMQPVPAMSLFRPPVTNNGLLGAYYPSPDWSGEPALTQTDPGIDYYFHITPLNRPYTVEWTGKLFAPATGEYRFALDSVDNSLLKIDNTLVVDNPNGHETVEGTITLTQGWHDIDVRFADKTGGTQIYLYWTTPGAVESVLVPAMNLLPPMGQYPATPGGLIPAQP